MVVAVAMTVTMTVVMAVTFFMLMSVPVVTMPVTVPVTMVAEEQGRSDIQKKAGAGSSEDTIRTRYR